MRTKEQLSQEYHRAIGLGGNVVASFNRGLSPAEQQTMDAILHRRVAGPRDSRNNKALGSVDVR